MLSPSLSSAARQLVCVFAVLPVGSPLPCFAIVFGLLAQRSAYANNFLVFLGYRLGHHALLVLQASQIGELNPSVAHICCRCN